MDKITVGCSAMTPDEQERMSWLCQRIEEEKDPKNSPRWSTN
jgi:uncharacterized NAD(P)/FAD-binding protein YdhS